MPRSVGVSVENSFVNGLITQASAFNFPENAVTDCDNVVFDETGIVSRRLGFEFEDGWASQIIVRTGSAVTQYNWRSVAGNGDYNFIVLQVGAHLYFYRVGEDGNVSANALPGFLDLTPFAIAGGPGLTDQECQFTSGYGKLFVTHPYMTPVYIIYDIPGAGFSVGPINIEIRDFEGVDDGLATADRPATLTDAHFYNLVNQGWVHSKILAFQTVYTGYPSNADVWWLYKNAEEVFQPRAGFEADRGNSPAPKGQVIIPAFFQNRTGVSGVPGIETISSGFLRPVAVEFFAGRCFFAGVQADGFNNKIYFSQVVENPRQFGKCYQENDPTSEYAFDLLPSDGGVIAIPEAGTIIKMVALDASLVVFCSNGVWLISGSDGSGFKANDYSVRKISTVAALTASSFVDISGTPCWWNVDGIYVATANQLGIEVKSLSETKVRAFLEGIPNDCKRFVKGAFNTVDKTVQWLYRSTPPETVEERYDYDRILNYNTLSSAYYPFSFGNPFKKIGGISAIEKPAKFKYLTFEDDFTTFAEIKNPVYADWGSELYESFFTTGYKLRGEGLRKFQANYVRLFSNGEAASKYNIQALWDWASAESTGRWSGSQQIIHLADDYKTQSRKVKLRGHGVACQFKISSVTTNPFDLLGWTVMTSVNNAP